MVNANQRTSTPATDAPNSTSTGQPDQFSTWLYTQISDYISGKILQIGCASGKLTEILIQNGWSLRISDPHRSKWQELQEKYSDNKSIKGIHRIDLAQEEFQTAYEKYLNKFDTVLSLNIVDKYYEQHHVWDNALQLLTGSGILILCLPAPTVPFNQTIPGLDNLQHANRQFIKVRFGGNYKIMKTRFFIICNQLDLDKHGQTRSEKMAWFRPDNGDPTTKLYMLAIIKAPEFNKPNS
jgi:2-polyprenyl-3-methyl-5-hydroxy-6-metoxy-1,4-benzoquinol methylase